jgi:hypothetical protein
MTTNFLSKPLDIPVSFRHNECMDTRKHLKAIAARQDRELMQSGVILRSVKFANKKKVASKNACRKGNWS